MKKLTLPTLLIALALMVSGAYAGRTSTKTTTHDSGSNLGRNSIAISFLGSYPGTVTSGTAKQAGAGASGMMFEYERINNPFFGYNVSYAFHGANQSYNTPTNITTKANDKEFAANWEVSTPTMHVLPVKFFGVVGLSYQRFSPTAGQVSTKTDSKWATQYGLGVNYSVLPHIAFRFQYRQDRYATPAITTSATRVNKSYHQSLPMFGIAFRF